jgi:hypothetical protein
VEALIRLAEKSAESVSPLTGLVACGYFYMNIPQNRAESTGLGIVLAVGMGVSVTTFCTKLMFGWPGTRQPPAPPRRTIRKPR